MDKHDSARYPVWYIEGRPLNGTEAEPGFAPADAEKMGSGVVIELEHLSRNDLSLNPPKIQKYLLTCGHVVRQGDWGPLLEEIYCWQPNKGFSRTFPNKRSSGTFDGVFRFKLTNIGPCNGQVGAVPPGIHHPSNDWALLECADREFQTMTAVGYWGEATERMTFTIIGFPGGAGFESARTNGHYWRQGDHVKCAEPNSFHLRGPVDRGLLLFAGPDECRPGMSGGGIFNENGDFVGIHRISFDNAMTRGSIASKHIQSYLSARHYRCISSLQNRVSGSSSFSGQLLKVWKSSARFVKAGISQEGKQSDKLQKSKLRLRQEVEKFLERFDDLYATSIATEQVPERMTMFEIRYRKESDFENSGSDSTGLFSSKDLIELYRKQGHRLILVGEAGTGKTYSLLSLMRALALDSKGRNSEPIPVYFNLSSWNLPHSQANSKALDIWLEDQLVRKYNVQRNAARQLIGTHQIIFCLDGLDEINIEQNAKSRDACVKAINESLKNNMAVRIILCCRTTTYKVLTLPPRLGEPLAAQFLTEDEVLHALEEPPLRGLRDAVNKSSFLKKKARVALFLAMMRIAYRDISEDAIISQTSDEAIWEQHLLDFYVQKCMSVPEASPYVNKDLIPLCLSWIARQPDNDFLLDDLQPSVLRIDSIRTEDESEKLWKEYRWSSIKVLSLLLALVETFPAGVSLATEWIAYGTVSPLAWGSAL